MMFADDLNVASGPAGGARISGDAALFLSKKVAAAQRELVQQLRTEAADRARPETSRKDPQTPLEAGKTDREDERGVEPRAESRVEKLDEQPPLDITV